MAKSIIKTETPIEAPKVVDFEITNTSRAPILFDNGGVVLIPGQTIVRKAVDERAYNRLLKMYTSGKIRIKDVARPAMAEVAAKVGQSGAPADLSQVAKEMESAGVVVGTSGIDSLIANVAGTPAKVSEFE